MSVKALFTYTLFLTLGIGAVTNAKTLLIEQVPQEAAQIEGFANRPCRKRSDGFHPTFLSLLPLVMRPTTDPVGLFNWASRCITLSESSTSAGFYCSRECFKQFHLSNAHYTLTTVTLLTELLMTLR